jgi:hypothetical protein
VVQVRDAVAWQLVDERLNEMRRLPYADLRRRLARGPELEQLASSGGRFRRRTRVMALYGDRLGIKVKVDAGTRRTLAEGHIITTSDGELAREWSLRG